MKDHLKEKLNEIISSYSARRSNVKEKVQHMKETVDYNNIRLQQIKADLDESEAVIRDLRKIIHESEQRKHN